MPNVYSKKLVFVCGLEQHCSAIIWHHSQHNLNNVWVDSSHNTAPLSPIKVYTRMGDSDEEENTAQVVCSDLDIDIAVLKVYDTTLSTHVSSFYTHKYRDFLIIIIIHTNSKLLLASRCMRHVMCKQILFISYLTFCSLNWLYVKKICIPYSLE